MLSMKTSNIINSIKETPEINEGVVMNQMEFK